MAPELDWLNFYDIFATSIGNDIDNWNSWGGFSTNYTTFKNEVCSFFEIAKLNAGYFDSWGSDTGDINVIIFKCTFDDKPGKTYILSPIFYVGNDSYADEVITI